jgi:hypothetical protein
MTPSASKRAVRFIDFEAFISRTADDKCLIYIILKQSTKGLLTRSSCRGVACSQPLTSFIIREVKPHVTKTKPTKTNAKRRKG